MRKGIESLQKQLELHKEKLKKAEGKGLNELTAYYRKEIENFEAEIAKKRRKLE